MQARHELPREDHQGIRPLNNSVTNVFNRLVETSSDGERSICEYTINLNGAPTSWKTSRFKNVVTTTEEEEEEAEEEARFENANQRLTDNNDNGSKVDAIVINSTVDQLERVLLRDVYLDNVTNIIVQIVQHQVCRVIDQQDRHDSLGGSVDFGTETSTSRLIVQQSPYGNVSTISTLCSSAYKRMHTQNEQ